MKKIFGLMALALVMTSLFTACDEDDEGYVPNLKESDISGVWMDFTMLDCVDRLFCFDDTTHMVTYYASSSTIKERLDLPYTFDKSTGEALVNFKSKGGFEGIDNILFKVIDNEDDNEVDYLIGLVNYADQTRDQDTLVLDYLCEAYSETWNEEYDFGFEDEVGPDGAEDFLAPPVWDNPFDEQATEVKGKTRGVIMTAILTWAGEKVLDFAKGKIEGAIHETMENIANAYWNMLFPGDDSTGDNVKEIMYDVQEIKGELKKINDKIDELAKQNRIAEGTKSLTDRNDRYNELSISISSAMERIEDALNDPDLTPEQDSLAITSAILEWGNGDYHNNKLYNSVEIYATKAMEAYGSQSYPELYDALAFETNAWESDAYEWREMLRTTDMAVVSSAATLSYLYWIVRHKINPYEVTKTMVEKNIDKIAAKISEMEAVYNAKAVVRHPDKMICQIANFHAVFDKEIEWRNLSNPTWFTNNPKHPYALNWIVYGGNNADGYNDIERFLTEEEYDKLMSFYSDEKGSLLTLLKKIGFDIKTNSPEDSKAMMPLPNGAIDYKAVAINMNYIICFKKAVSNETKKTETTVKIGEAWTPLTSGGSKLLKFFKDQRRFDHFVDYYDHTWFNLRVLSR